MFLAVNFRLLQACQRFLLTVYTAQHSVHVQYSTAIQIEKVSLIFTCESLSTTCPVLPVISSDFPVWALRPRVFREIGQKYRVSFKVTRPNH